MAKSNPTRSPAASKQDTPKTDKRKATATAADEPIGLEWTLEDIAIALETVESIGRIAAEMLCNATMFNTGEKANDLLACLILFERILADIDRLRDDLDDMHRQGLEVGVAEARP